MFRLRKKTLTSENYTDGEIVQAALEKLRIKMTNDIKTDYNLDINIYTDKEKSTSATSIYKPTYMRIGTRDIFDNMSRRRVRNQDFVRAVFAFHHENTHVYQNQEVFQQKHPDDFDRLMAVQKVIGIVIPEYYNKTYWESNLFEIQAESHGISNTIEYFKESFPEIDVEKELVNIINSEDNWYAKRPVSSIEDAYQKLDMQAEKSLSANVQLYKNSFGLDQNSPAFQAFYNQTNMDAFNEKSADEQRNILLQFVAEYTPSVIRHYRALSDVPTADGPDRIPWDGELYRKPATTPQENKHAERVAFLTERFGNLIADNDEEHDDSPGYE